MYKAIRLVVRNECSIRNMVLMPGCDTLGGDIIKTAFIWIAQNKVGNATDRKALWKEALEN